MSAKLFKVGRKWRTASEAWYLDIQYVPYLMSSGVGGKRLAYWFCVDLKE
jgi:hypothetical protein